MQAFRMRKSVVAVTRLSFLFLGHDRRDYFFFGGDFNTPGIPKSLGLNFPDLGLPQVPVQKLSTPVVFDFPLWAAMESGRYWLASMTISMPTAGPALPVFTTEIRRWWRMRP